MKRSYCLALMVFSGLGAFFLGISGPAVSALISDKKMFISADNTFYAYVKGGENINASFARSDQKEPSNLPAEDVKVTLDGPQLAQQTCILAKTIAIGQGCSFNDVVAPASGIYRIGFALPETAPLYKEVSPTVRWGANMFSWSIAISDSGGMKLGRIWSELYAVRQPEQREFATDLLYYYMSENGYLYRAAYKGYHGQISTFSADAFGIRSGEKCESAYRSSEVSDEKLSPAFGACGGSYKLFFEQPAGELPSSAKRWDGKDEWVSPPISRPLIEGLRFESDKNGDTQSGKIKFTLKNFVGQYKIKIDVNSDGNYDAAEDITFSRTMKKNDHATQEVAFNGIDGDGRSIPASQRIGIKMQIEKMAEIHLVNADVEGRTGGLELMRLNGDNAPTTRMCWDDTELPELADTSVATKQLDGRDCPDSVKGVHGWPYATGGWGDGRYIDDWAYAAARLDGTGEIHYPESEAAASAKQNGLMQGVIATAIGILIVIGVLGFIIIMTIRRNRHIRRLKEAQERQTPIDYPGPGAQPPPRL